MAKKGGLSPEDIVSLDQLSARLASGTYYELLGVARDASRQEIRSAFFVLSKRFHPDRFFRVDLGPRQAQVEQVFSALTRAYETLARGAVRRMYDAQLGEESASTNPASASAEATAVGEAAQVQSPSRPQPARAPQGQTPARPRHRKSTGPSAHVLQQLASRVRQREAENAARHQSVVPPPPVSGRSAASALARELMHHASGDQLRVRGYLRSAELAENEQRWGDAYRFLSLAQRMAPNQVGLVRRMEQAHQAYLVQAAPDNTAAAKAAESNGNFAQAAALWSRVAEATNEVDALVAAARNYLKCPHHAEQAKAGQLARRAVALSPSHTRANRVLLDFFEHAGMERSAKRQRAVLEDLK